MDSMHDVKKALEEFGDATKNWKSEREEFKDFMRRHEARANRERLALGGAGGERSDFSGNLAERKALERFFRSGDETELKAMFKSSDPSGGYTVPPDFGAEISRLALDMSPLRKIAKVLKVSRSDFKQLVAAGSMGAEWRSESATRSETTTTLFATVAPPSGEISSVVPITRWLLEDSEYDLAQFIAEETARSHAVSEGAAFAAGDAINKPSGVLTQPHSDSPDSTRPFGTLQEVFSGTAGSIAGGSGVQADPLIDMLYALKPEYRANASWLMHPGCAAQARKLKDTQGQLLWSPSMVAGQPATLLGIPLYEDPNLEAPGTGSRSVVVGDFSRGYLILDIGQPVMIRDDVTSKGRVLFEVARRTGGAVLDTCALKTMRLATS